MLQEFRLDIIINLKAQHNVAGYILSFYRRANIVVVVVVVAVVVNVTIFVFIALHAINTLFL